MGSLSKLPPEVARELRRHVSPRPLKDMSASATSATSNPKAAARLLQQQQQQQQQQNQRPGTGWILGGCVVLTGTAFATPFAAQHWIGNLNNRDEPLTHAQIRRGAFLNSGSTDAGKDPQWDFRNGQYKKDDNYWAIFDADKTPHNAAQQAFGALAAIGGGKGKVPTGSGDKSDSTNEAADKK